MRKEYGKALRKLFSTRMRQLLPRFEEVKVKSIYCAPGERQYRWIASEPVHCWIVLSPDLKGHDQFHVLIGWSKKARYPELSMIPCPDEPTPDHAEFTREEYLIRLPQLWTKIDSPWAVREFHAPTSVADMQAALAPIPPEQARKEVEPQVEAAIARLVSDGMPYLKVFATTSGSAG